jgi:hypothetical protein
MKKCIIAIITIFLSGSATLMAQTEFDALKLVQTDINGTARYMGMAGAFGALGGDMSAIKDNPAGLGIYRSSEFVATANILMQNSASKWNGENGFNDLYKIGANNVGLVIASPTFRRESGTEGLQSSNWSFGYNRLKQFDRALNIKGKEANSSISDYMAFFSEGITESSITGSNDVYRDFPWLTVLGYDSYLINPFDANGNWDSNISQTITPSYLSYEKGYIDEYSLGWAGNFSNFFYVGATLNLHAIDYSLDSKYKELYGGNSNMYLQNNIRTTGSAISLKLGGIVSPNDYLRFGLSVHTPTVYALNDKFYSVLNYSNIPYNTELKSGTNETPEGISGAYQMQSPMQINASAAFILGKKGIISAEYNFSNYGTTRLRGESGDPQSFDLENEGMPLNLNDVRTIRIGGEYRVSDNFSVRAGYANSNNATKPGAAKEIRLNTIRTDTEYFLHNRTDYLTAGFGYRESNWFLDFAYMNKNVNESFYPYNTNTLSENNADLAVQKASVITTNNNLVVTLGFKF